MGRSEAPNEKAIDPVCGMEVEPKHPKRKGWFGRYLERLSKANEEHFDPKGPRCH
jgi:hypothetical protein